MFVKQLLEFAKQYNTINYDNNAVQQQAHQHGGKVREICAELNFKQGSRQRSFTGDLS